MDTSAIIDRCRLFARVNPERRARLAAIAVRQELVRGRIVFRQDDPPPGIYVVGSGLVRVYKLAPSGKEHILHLAGPGQTFAEVAVMGQFNCPAFAEVVDDAEVALLPTESVSSLLRADHQLCLELLVGMSAWVHHLTGLLEDIVLRDAAGRIARHLLNCAGDQGVVVLPGLKKHLASHLNLTSETLSRTLRRFTDAGWLEALDDQRMRVTDVEALQAVCDGM
jgi:CRP/FNR family transcriptional regulator